MYTYKPTDKDHIHVYGRTVMTDPMPLFWTASGIEFSTDSTECWMDIVCEYQVKEQYIRVEINGFMTQRILLLPGDEKICLFRGMPAGELKTITVRLESQPMEDDEKRKLLIKGISCDCLLQPVEEKSCKIEIIGDSLTSGEGLTGTQDSKEWCTAIYGLNSHYGLAVAKHFDADYSIVSQSGWGVYCGWDNNMHCNIPSIYEKVCGVAVGEENDKLGASGAYDFTSYNPDLVIINLGTNDGGAASNDIPAWTDPVTGKEYKQKYESEGNLDGKSQENLENAVYSFLTMVRKNNPAAYILWVYGMCEHPMEKYLIAAINKYSADNNDERCSYLRLPASVESQLGAHFHPGALDHEASSAVIIEEIEKLGILA